MFRLKAVGTVINDTTKDQVAPGKALLTNDIVDLNAVSPTAIIKDVDP